jgi:hypothetical protein
MDSGAVQPMSVANDVPMSAERALIQGFFDI